MSSSQKSVLIFTLVWLTSMVSLSLGSGYTLPEAAAAVPFDPGAIFLTPIGIVKHFIEQPEAIYPLYFRESVRSGISDNFWLLLIICVNTVLAFIGMRRIAA